MPPGVASLLVIAHAPQAPFQNPLHRPTERSAPSCPSTRPQRPSTRGCHRCLQPQQRKWHWRLACSCSTTQGVRDGKSCFLCFHPTWSRRGLSRACKGSITGLKSSFQWLCPGIFCLEPSICVSIDCSIGVHPDDSSEAGVVDRDKHGKGDMERNKDSVIGTLEELRQEIRNGVSRVGKSLSVMCIS
jgi:hypothetical protein